MKKGITSLPPVDNKGDDEGLGRREFFDSGDTILI